MGVSCLSSLSESVSPLTHTHTHTHSLTPDFNLSLSTMETPELSDDGDLDAGFRESWG